MNGEKEEVLIFLRIMMMMMMIMVQGYFANKV
jgi:hypothetical protein